MPYFSTKNNTNEPFPSVLVPDLPWMCLIQAVYLLDGFSLSRHLAAILSGWTGPLKVEDSAAERHLGRRRGSSRLESMLVLSLVCMFVFLQTHLYVSKLVGFSIIRSSAWTQNYRFQHQFRPVVSWVGMFKEICPLCNYRLEIHKSATLCPGGDPKINLWHLKWWLS